VAAEVLGETRDKSKLYAFGLVAATAAIAIGGAAAIGRR
jgi:hypothetical protein